MAQFRRPTRKSVGKVGLMLAAALPFLIAGTAKADILLTLMSVMPSGSDYLYTYDVMLAGGSVLHAAGGGANTGVSPSNNFFTLYDIQGLVSGSESYTGSLGVMGNSSFTEQALGVTPAGQSPVPPDSGSLPNITTYWTGADLTAATAPADLGTFSFLSTNPLGSLMLAYAAATQKLELFPDAAANNIAQVLGPGPSVVPEPSTLTLLVIGLAVLRAVAKRNHAMISRIGSAPSTPTSF
jgi:hypothetical protein